MVFYEVSKYTGTSHRAGIEMFLRWRRRWGLSEYSRFEVSCDPPGGSSWSPLGLVSPPPWRMVVIFSLNYHHLLPTVVPRALQIDYLNIECSILGQSDPFRGNFLFGRQSSAMCHADWSCFSIIWLSSWLIRTHGGSNFTDWTLLFPLQLTLKWNSLNWKIFRLLLYTIIKSIYHNFSVEFFLLQRAMRLVESTRNRHLQNLYKVRRSHCLIFFSHWKIFMRKFNSKFFY